MGHIRPRAFFSFFFLFPFLQHFAIVMTNILDRIYYFGVQIDILKVDFITSKAEFIIGYLALYPVFFCCCFCVDIRHYLMCFFVWQILTCGLFGQIFQDRNFLWATFLLFASLILMIWVFFASCMMKWSRNTNLPG